MIYVNNVSSLPSRKLDMLSTNISSTLLPSMHQYTSGVL